MSQIPRRVAFEKAMQLKETEQQNAQNAAASEDDDDTKMSSGAVTLYIFLILFGIASFVITIVGGIKGINKKDCNQAAFGLGIAALVCIIFPPVGLILAIVAWALPCEKKSRGRSSSNVFTSP